jgi:lipoprotein-releasing system permease protein
MTFGWTIAFRFLKAGKGQSVFILLGISIGVSVMIFLNTLISGLQKDLINQTVGSSAHIVISPEEDVDLSSGEKVNKIFANGSDRQRKLTGWEGIISVLENRSDITAIAPIVNGNGFYRSKGKDLPLQIKGWRIEDSDKIYDIKGKILQGSSDLQGSNILVGDKFLIDNSLSIGDIITLNLGSGISDNFTIRGSFDLGSDAINGSWIIMDMKRAQKFLAYQNDITAIEIQIKEVFDAPIIDENLSNRFEGVEVTNWIDNNGSLLTALQSQSSSSIMIQVFVLLAITLGISSVLAVSVVQKSKQLGILKAMGTKARQASRIFLLQGAILGTIGAVSGIGLGIVLIQGFLIGTSAATGTPLFPLVVEWQSMTVIGLIAIVSSTIAAFIPAQKSSKLNPVEVIRNG